MGNNLKGRYSIYIDGECYTIYFSTWDGNVDKKVDEILKGHSQVQKIKHSKNMCFTELVDMYDIVKDQVKEAKKIRDRELMALFGKKMNEEIQKTINYGKGYEYKPYTLSSSDSITLEIQNPVINREAFERYFLGNWDKAKEQDMDIRSCLTTATTTTDIAAQREPFSAVVKHTTKMNKDGVTFITKIESVDHNSDNVFSIRRSPVMIDLILDEWDGNVDATMKVISKEYGWLEKHLYFRVRSDIERARYEKFKPRNSKFPKPKKVHFSGPCTIIIWEDKTKTIVRCQDGDTFDPEVGISMCYLKKLLGNEGNYYNHIRKAKKMANYDETSKYADKVDVKNFLKAVDNYLKGWK